MQALVITVFLVSTLMDFIATFPGMPLALKLTPEIVSAYMVVILMARAVRDGISLIPIKYWLLYGFLTVVILCGIFTNSVGTGPILAGMRYMLRAMPMFFLPALAKFSNDDIRKQLKVFLGIALLQVPVAIYQRLVIFSQDRFSGDDVRGTVMSSGILSIMLICVVCIMTAMYIRGQIRRLPFIILFFVLLFPTTINETKATVIFLPLGLLCAIFVASPPQKRFGRLLGGVTMLGAFAAILIPVYALMNANSPYKDDKDLVGFFTNEKQFDQYVNDKKEAGFGTKHAVGRGTAIRFPLQYLARDPVRLSFGLGMGNASHSNLGENFTGRYFDLFQNFMVSAVAGFLLELGLLGTLLVFALYWAVTSDCIVVARTDDGLLGAIAAGWVGVVAVIALSNFYNVGYTYASISYPYWYFAGMIATRRMQLLAAKRQVGAAQSLRRMAA